MDQDLQDFIKQSKESGMADEQIKQELLKVGWDENDINQAINLDFKQSSKNIWKIVVPIIIVAIIGGGIYWWQKSADETEQQESQVAINTLPMYGGVEKTAEQKAADEKLIQGAIEEMGSREEAAKLAVERGWEFYYSGDMDTAMKRFNQAWLLDSSNPDIFWGFGLIVGSQGQDDEALRMFNLGLEIDPDNTMLMCNVAYAYTNKAITNLDKKDFYLNEAIKYFDKANSIDSEVAYCHSVWAVTLFHQGLYDEASNHVDKAMILGGNLDPIFLRDLAGKLSEDDKNMEY